jgi:hypothetical protein
MNAGAEEGIPLMAPSLRRGPHCSLCLRCVCEVSGTAGRRDPLPRHLREDRLKRIEKGRDTLGQEQDILLAHVEALVAETNGLEYVERSKTLEVEDLRADVAPQGTLSVRAIVRSV